MLARLVVVIAVQRALAAAPEVHAEAAVDLVLGADALAHTKYPVAVRFCPDSSGREGPDGACALRLPAFSEVRRSIVIGRRVSKKAAAPGGLRGRSEEHTSELQSLMRTSYAVFCLKK